MPALLRGINDFLGIQYVHSKVLLAPISWTPLNAAARQLGQVAMRCESHFYLKKKREKRQKIIDIYVELVGIGTDIISIRMRNAFTKKGLNFKIFFSFYILFFFFFSLLSFLFSYFIFVYSLFVHWQWLLPRRYLFIFPGSQTQIMGHRCVVCNRINFKITPIFKWPGPAEQINTTQPPYRMGVSGAHKQNNNNKKKTYKTTRPISARLGRFKCYLIFFANAAYL